MTNYFKGEREHGHPPHPSPPPPTDMSFLCNSVDPDQLASSEANWSGSALFAIQYLTCINNLDQVIWLAEN